MVQKANYRRTGIGVIGVAAALGATTVLTTGWGSARAAAVPGRGNASAQTVAVTPREGSLAVGVVLGEAIAGHQNTQAKAQSQAIDLGSIGTSLTSYDCGQNPTFTPQQIPQPLIVESGTPGADKGVTQSEESGAFTKYGLANLDPFAKAVTTSLPFGIAGVAQVGGGTATTWSGMVNGSRVAGATVDVSGLSLPGGISLSGLHWEAVYPSGTSAVPTGSFTIGHMSVGGVPVTVVKDASALGQANALLGTVGLQLNSPAAHVTQGIMSVDPLQLSVVPNATRDGLTGPVIAGIQPVRQPLTAAILKAFCKADTPLTVADIGIGSVTGSGSFQLSLGGVSATSGLVPANQFSLGFNLGAPGAGAIPGSPGTPGTPGTPGSDGGVVDAPAGAPAAAASGGSVPVGATSGPAGLLQRAAALRGHRGGALAAVGLLGLGLLGILAEGDRRMMRRAQRTEVFSD